MDLRQLRSFITVADHKNFTAAAQRLGIAQPPLSRQIQLLEEEIGAQLIDRSCRPLKLTPVGRLLYEQARQVLGRVDDMQGMLKRAAKTEQRHMRIGFVASTIYARLPPIIRAFRAAAPTVELVLQELTTLEQITALKEGSIDVGFGRIRFEDDAVKRIVLREERLVVALPAGNELAAKKTITLDDLATQPLILYPRTPRPSYADQVLGLYHDRGLVPLIAHEARELQIAIGLVAAEEGICIVPESVQKSNVDGVIYKEIAEPITSPIILSYHAGRHTPELALMAKIIAETYTKWGYPIPHALARLYGDTPTSL